MEARSWLVVAAAVVLALPLGGCRGGGQTDWLPVGTCVRDLAAGGSAPVPCAEPHTHRVIAIVGGDGEACPGETDVYMSPADPHDGRLTWCLRAEAAGE
jgi:hypothetical protein